MIFENVERDVQTVCLLHETKNLFTTFKRTIHQMHFRILMHFQTNGLRKKKPVDCVSIAIWK